MPILTVFAGPNGSGKSSISQRLEFEGRLNLLDTDAIARRINPDDPRAAAVEAGREVLTRTREFIENRESFAIETTLAGNTALAVMRRTADLGYVVRLIYLCLSSPERSIRRVRERAAQGGHDVPDEDIRRRYARSVANLSTAIRLADEAVMYDNSGKEPKRVIQAVGGRIVWSDVPLPEWTRGLVAGLS
jgi:predicted ABC-type ATPase